ncbi:TonB-dependent receptor plug domain-containing protein [Saccharicrinis sp. FJH62]|uniref:TonB-dependent receptor n=1 Tax=Saccharicrinis sp. FJH62 TaxID=3344657 RepID=UPI0035D48D79
MRSALFVILVLSFYTGISFGQDRISGNYYNTDWNDFVNEIEGQTNFHVFYDSIQTREILVNALLSNTPVERVLSSVLKPVSLNFLIRDSSIYIYKGEPVITKLNFINVADTAVEIKSYDMDSENGFMPGQYRFENIEKVIVGENQGNYSKPVSVKIYIQSMEDGAPIPGASLYFDEEGKGTISDLEGYINLDLVPGKYNATLNYIGRDEKNIELDVRGPGIAHIELMKKAIPIKEVTVRQSVNNTVANMNTGFERMEYKTLKDLPTMLGENDVLKAVQMLPGVESVGEGTSGLYIRGSNADQNLVYFNSIPVYNTSHLFGFFSAFNGELINDLNLYKSHMPASYGGRLASVMELNSKNGDLRKFKMSGAISPITASIIAEVPVIKDKASIIASYRSTFSDYILSRLESPLYKQSSGGFNDLSVSANYLLSSTSSIKGTVYYSKDQFQLGTLNKYEYSNKGYSVVWKKVYNTNLATKLELAGTDYFNQNFTLDPVSHGYKKSYSLLHNEAKFILTYSKIKNNIFKAGLDGILYNINRSNVEPLEGSVITEIPITNEKAVETAAFLSDEIELTKFLKLYLGIRYSDYFYLGPKDINTYISGIPRSDQNIEKVTSYANNEVIKNYSGGELRMAMNYMLNENNSIKVSFDQGQQYLYLLSNTNAISPQDQWKLSDSFLKPSKGYQMSLGYYRSINYPSMSLSLEVYKKSIDNVLQYKDGANLITKDNIETEVLQGQQDAYGIEFMLKKNKGILTGWFSYAYSNSSILVDGNEPWQKINNGLKYPSDYDIPHSVNFYSVLRASRRLSFATNAVYATGRPMTYPQGLYYVNGLPFFDYSSRNAGRIPDYFRVDMSVNLEGNLRRKKAFHSWWSVGVYNVTGRKNAYSVFFRSEEKGLQGYKLSIIGVPVFTVTWNFKLGNYEN